MPSRWLSRAKHVEVFLFAGSARKKEYQKKALEVSQRKALYRRLTKRGPGGLPEEGHISETY